MLTAGEAACYIYNLTISTENEQLALNNLESAGLEPVYLSSGDPLSPVAMGTAKINCEPWKYKRYLKKEITVEKTTEEQSIEDSTGDSSTASFEICTPTSRRAVIDLLKSIFPLTTSHTKTEFMTEDDIFKIVKEYLPQNSNINSEKVNYWIGQEGYWTGIKRKQVNNVRKNGRQMNLVREEYRNFTLKDIANIQEYRKYIRCSLHTSTTIGYARKSKSEKSKAAIESSINLQSYKLKTKLLCSSVFGSYSDANDDISDRDHKQKKQFKFNCDGDTQDMISKISTATTKIRLVFIDYAGLSTRPEEIRKFVGAYKQIKELVIDTGVAVEIISRFDIMKNDEIIKKFLCRKACEKRSE